MHREYYLNGWAMLRTGSHLSRRAQPDAAPDAGFTLVELVVVASLLMLVLGAILGVLESLTNTEHTTSQRIDDEQSARVTLAQLERDVRGAAALMVQGPAPSSTTMDLQLADGPNQVAWVFDLTGAHTLTRSENGNITAVLADVVSGGFSYSDATGQSSSWLTPGDIARYATIVQAEVAVGSHPHTAPQSLSVEDAVRNQSVVGCT